MNVLTNRSKLINILCNAINEGNKSLEKKAIKIMGEQNKKLLSNHNGIKKHQKFKSGLEGLSNKDRSRFLNNRRNHSNNNK
jgi:hypothetical protein